MIQVRLFFFHFLELQQIDVGAMCPLATNDRAGHQAIAVDDNTMWLIGGLSGGSVTTQVMSFDVTTQAYADVSIANMPQLCYFSAHKIGSKVYLVGGYIGLSGDWYANLLQHLILVGTT